jgi:hypothetical protein
MGHRVNIILDDKAWRELREVPAGERSRLVSEAVTAELSRRRRLTAIQDLQALRSTGRHRGVAAEDLVRKDRKAH